MLSFKKVLIFVLVSFFWVELLAQSSYLFTPSNTLGHIEYLASEHMKGRRAGSQEGLEAARYIRDQFHKSGLQLIADDGFQEFEMITGISMGEGNLFVVNGRSLELGADYTPLPFSKNSTLNSTAIFIGYGLQVKNDSLSWDDFAGVDLHGKWALILRGNFKTEKGDVFFGDYVDERFKVMLAQDHGAAGVIFVSGERFDSEDLLLKLSYDKSPTTSNIPVVQIKRSIIDELLVPFGLSIGRWEEEITKQHKPVNSVIPLKFDINVNLNKDHSVARNVVAMIEGSDPLLKDEFIVIGAHYDHLGLGGFGSGSRIPDTVAVHYGADDNASGVAGIVELAKYFSDKNIELKRSLLFISFDAEEMGLLGSRYFINNPLIELKKIVAMINFDMIGRLNDNNAITIGGTGTSLETELILNQLSSNSPLKLSYSSKGYGPSDHAMFYSENIPVFFFFTGAHADYHTHRDNISGINAEGIVSILQFATGLVGELANRDAMLTFQEAGPSKRGEQRYNFKITLGIMPDITSSGDDGLRVDAVRPDGPAAMGGILKGDVIIAIDGNHVGNIYDYMGRLKSLEVGQVISVDVMRNNKHKVLIIQL